MSKIAGCVILYNPEDAIYDNIVTYGDFVEKLIVVDNSTNKNSTLINKLQARFNSNIIYIDNGDNLGIATALNIGCDKAMEFGFDWILTMDQDSSFENFEHYLKCLDSIKDRDDIALLAAHTDEKKNNSELLGLEYEERFIVITSANILNLKYFEKIGRFEDKLFIDLVDYDYCIRANIQKLKILLFKDVYVKHALGEVFLRTNIFTRKKKYKTEHSAQRAYYIARNYMYMASKYGRLYPKEMSMFHIINITFIHDVTKILLYEFDKINKLKAKFLGLYHFLIGRYGKYELRKS